MHEASIANCRGCWLKVGSLMGALTVSFKDLSSFFYVHGILNDVKNVFKRGAAAAAETLARETRTRCESQQEHSWIITRAYRGGRRLQEVNKRPEAAKGNRRDRKRHDGGRERGRNGEQQRASQERFQGFVLGMSLSLCDSV